MKAITIRIFCLITLPIMLQCFLKSIHRRSIFTSSPSRSFSIFQTNISNEQQSQSAPIPNNKKVIIVTGGVISGIGKGITASSIGVVLKMLGKKVTYR